MTLAELSDLFDIPIDAGPAYDMLVRTRWPGFFWLACALYLALGPQDARRRYILALDSLRRLGAVR